MVIMPIRNDIMRHLFIAAAVLSSGVYTAPASTSYVWTPRKLSCEYYGGTNTRCTIKLDNEVVERNPGCFEESNLLTNETRVYCGLSCEESDETTILRKIPQWKHDCSMFYNYNLERRRQDWYVWRSGKCVNSTVEFDVLCGTPTNPKEFYFKNEHLFEYEDASQ